MQIIFTVVLISTQIEMLVKWDVCLILIFVFAVKQSFGNFVNKTSASKT